MELAENRMKAVFCLAHLCLPEHNEHYKDYIRFFRQKKEDGYFVLMDNGAAENTLVDYETLCRLIKRIKPTEVVLPDILYDSKQTVKAMFEFTKMMNDNGLIGKVQIMGVPQGRSSLEWHSCYVRMLENPLITTIGLSKFSVPACFAVHTDSPSISVNRRYLIRNLFSSGLIMKPFHLLGMRSITEFLAYKRNPLMRSTDSAFTILAAIHGKLLNEQEILNDVGGTPPSYFDTVLTTEQLNKAKQNINTFARVVECKI